MSEIDSYLDLPEDPELAFVEYEKQIRKEMWDNIKDDHVDYSYIQDQKVHYCTKVMAFHDAHNFGFLKKPVLYRKDIDFDANFDMFMDEVNYWTTQIAIRHAQRLRPIQTILRLTPEIRQQLHSYINRIRETIAPIELPSNKKDALLSKLNALADEIDRDRTKTEAWTAFVLEIAGAGGQAARELKPVKDLADAIGSLLGKAKEMADRLGLPSPAPRKRIEGPRDRLPPPQPEKMPDELDDDIPF